MYYNTQYTDEDKENIFAQFVGQPVKCPYRDGEQFKIARGVLEGVQPGFVKIRGPLGIIIINEQNIEKMALLTRSR